MVTIQEVRKQLNLFLKAGFKLETFEYGRTKYGYYVVDVGWDELPTDYPSLFSLAAVDQPAVRAGTSIELCSVFGVSNAVPPASRPIVVLHDLLEHAILPLDADGCKEAGGPCAYACNEERRLLPQRLEYRDRIAHIRMRARFWREALEYAQRGSAVTPRLVMAERFWREAAQQLLH